MTLHLSWTVAAPHTGQTIASSAVPSTFVVSGFSWLGSFNAWSRIPAARNWQIHSVERCRGARLGERLTK
jgi:hypothetical protein